jgi:hypothetical protein
MDKLRVLTKECKLLNLLRLGDNGKDGSDMIECVNRKDESIKMSVKDVQMVFGSYKLSGLEVATKDGDRMSVVCIGEDGQETGSNVVTCTYGGRTRKNITIDQIEKFYGVYNFFNYKKGGW